jgi:hypothetical protein
MFTTIVKYHSLSQEDRDSLGTIDSEAPEVTIALASKELRMIERSLRLAVVLGVLIFTALVTHLFFDPLTLSFSSLLNFVKAFFVAIIPNIIVFIFLLALADKFKRIYLHQSKRQRFVVSIHKLWMERNEVP